MKTVIEYKNNYIKVKVNNNYIHIGKSYRFTSIKDMKNIIKLVKAMINEYNIIATEYNNKNYCIKDYAIFYIPVNKIIFKWIINNILYYLHINKHKHIHLRIYK